MDESKRLVLHFDVDEILLESAEDCVNVALANSAVVRKKSPLGTGALASTRRAPSFDDYVWHDGSHLCPALRLARPVQSCPTPLRA